MSEVSDAVVVIVSEENGNISAAIGGVLKRPLEPETLDRLLRKELCGEETGEEDAAFSTQVLKKLSGRAKEDGNEKK